ncbi:MAG: heme exporter protein CcmD [Pseudomonadota bacterium]
MNWGSLAEFAAMGGYAPFVWGSYGVAALSIAVEIALLLRRIKKVRRAAVRVALA